MNLAQILAPSGLVDYERVPLEAPGSPFAQITVREWSAAKQRHEERYVGLMRFPHICTLAAERTGMPLE